MHVELSHVSLAMSFESIRIPPFEDICVISRKNPHGIHGLMKCLDFIAPDEFDLIEIDDETVEAVIINRRLLKRVSKDTIIKLLEKNVFSEMGPGDIIKVDMDVRKTMQIHQDFNG